jgi:hypothetical protein
MYGFLTKNAYSMDTIFFINGVYDVLCAISILGIVHIPILDELHLSVLKKHKKENPAMDRFLAYWLFTYGLIRIFGSRRMIAYSYFTEAFVLGNEWVNYDADSSQAVFIIASSVLLGVIALYV